MMYPYPFFGFPSFRRYYRAPFTPNSHYEHNTNPSFTNNNSNLNKNVKENSNSSFEDRDIFSNTEEEFFDFFGIKLAFDDLLILALLFFLYKEETKDPYLYISLILLLLS